MIVNLWSTPRTGSNWYSEYLFNQYKTEYKNLCFYKQYLNQFHFINYVRPGYNDFIYHYNGKCSYTYYFIDFLGQKITHKNNITERTLTSEEEESYRLSLLEKHNFTKNPSLFYNHVKPMSETAYNKLFSLADKNIFLYRKDIKRQISSYALAYGTKQYKPTVNQTIYQNIQVDYEVLKNLVDRILHWYSLDKSGCEIVCYEDLDFADSKNSHTKQNFVDPFIQLDSATQNGILQLIEYYEKSKQKNL